MPTDPANIIQYVIQYGSWPTAGAILLSAVIGAAVALCSISEQRKIARRRATIDLLARKEWDKYYLEDRKEFNRLRNDPKGLVHWASTSYDETDEKSIIRNILNYYELIAVGIKEGTLDEEAYKRWFRSTLIKDWKQAKAFIMEVRRNTNAPTIFCELEELAKKWGAENSPS